MAVDKTLADPVALVPPVRTREDRRRTRWRFSKSALTPYMFIAPNMVLFTVFVFLPLLYAFYISLREWSLLDTPRYIGFENYARLATDKLFWQSIQHTAVYSLSTVPTSLAIGLALALGLNRDLLGRTFLRSIFFVPVVISSVATAVIAAWLFNDNYGVINMLLRRVGLGPVAWLSSPNWALLSLVLTTLWVRVGFCMVVYLAALQSISPTYYDAAQMDGATRRQQFLYVTWPLLRPATFLLLILSVIHSFQVFDLIYVMTGGGPGFSTTMVVQYIYQAAFVSSEMGYASAMGVVLFFIILGFTLLQWRVNRRKEDVA